MVGFFYHEVKIILTIKGLKKEGENEEFIFFYDKMATLSWDLDRWCWVDGYCFLNYIIKFGRDSVFNRRLGTTYTVDKWQAYFPGNYKFYQSKV